MDLVEIKGNFYPFDNRIVRRNLNPAGNEYKELKRYVKNWRVSIDGGAYVGLWSRAMARDFGTVYAFELAPENFACLKKNAPAAISFNMALGDKPGRCAYDPDGNMDSPVFRVSDGDMIDVTTIDSLGLDICDFIKLDLQGYDHLALLGARETLVRCKPVVVFEHEKKCFIRYGVKEGDPHEFLSSIGYKRLVRGRNPVYGPC